MSKLNKVGNIYVADLETSHENGKSWVWLWDYRKLREDIHFQGNTIEEFVDDIIQSDASRVYFHNLGFDITFVFSELKRRGWEQADDEAIFEDNCYRAIVNNSNEIYSFTMSLTTKNRRGRLVTRNIQFLDSYKILPLDVDQLGEDINLPKLDIDHSIVRRLPYEASREERDYIKRDTDIVAYYLREMFDLGLAGNTIGVMSYDFFKRTYENSNIGISFKDLFPDLSGIDSELREAYYGGITYIKESIKGKVLGYGSVLDINSMYPHKLLYFDLPYGYPKTFEGVYDNDVEYPYFIQRLVVTCKLKEGHIPCIRQSGFNTGITYESVFEEADLTLTNFDLQLLYDHYDIQEIAFFGGYKFKVLTKSPFKYYVEFWADKKAKSNGAHRVIAKLMLNNLIGKLGAKPYRYSKQPILRDGIMYYDNLEKSKASTGYLPIAIFVNAMSRQQIIDFGSAIANKVNYIDTDALHISGDLPDFLLEYIHPTKLGYFKIEGQYERACYKTLKKYAEEGDGELIIKCSGVNKKEKLKVNFDMFVKGCTVNRLVQKNFEGGAALVTESFQI